MKLHEYVKEELAKKNIRVAKAAKNASVDAGGLSNFLQGKKKLPSTRFVVRLFVGNELPLEMLKELEM